MQMYRHVNFSFIERTFLIIHLSSQTAGKPPSVHTAAALFQKLCYENKDVLSASIIVAGWDATTGPSVYTIPIGGGLFRQPWAIGGKSSQWFEKKRKC
jgi:20S proteasome subunit beta 1